MQLLLVDPYQQGEQKASRHRPSMQAQKAMTQQASSKLGTGGGL